jgi:ABC-type proline/glycine betaine transport system permease subunit
MILIILLAIVMDRLADWLDERSARRKDGAA